MPHLTDRVNYTEVQSGIEVFLDDDREQLLIGEFKPVKEKCELCGLNEKNKKCDLAEACAGPYQVTANIIKIYDLSYENY